MHTHIASMQNKQIKYLRKLLTEKDFRGQEKRFVAEGETFVHDLLERTQSPATVFITDTYAEKKYDAFVRKTRSKKVTVHVVTASVLERITALSRATSMCGIFAQPSFDFDAIVEKKASTCIYCEQLQDPVNLGAIIRSCYCLGADALCISSNSVDVFNPKVVRSAAGYIDVLPVFSIDDNNFEQLRKAGFIVYASQCSQEKQCTSLKSLTPKFPKRLFCFGNEGAGLSKRMLSLADALFYIPMQQKADSLNVNNAVAITLYAAID